MKVTTFNLALILLLVFTLAGCIYENGFEAKEITFINSSDGVKLAGTLTLPRQAGIFPAV